VSGLQPFLRLAKDTNPPTSVKAFREKERQAALLAKQWEEDLENKERYECLLL